MSQQQTIGRYQVLEEIASGGMGSVLRVFDPVQNRVAALKVLLPHVADNKEYVERFKREASIASSIDHPNIVPIYEVGVDGDQNFMSLEFLPESLSRVIEIGGMMRIESAAEFGAQICSGLQAAHDRGVVHRDMKPQNVLIGTDGNAKITDFGIARSAQLSSMTATGAVMGTPYYMSPEQSRGEELDVRSDIYSVGCMLYEMLSGRVPFHADNPMAVIMMQIDEEPQRLRRIRSDIPRAFESVVTKAMEKDPARRFQTSAEMGAAIDAAVPSAQREEAQANVAAGGPAPLPIQPAGPMTPSQTMMDSFAEAFAKSNKKKWAWLTTLIPLTLSIVGFVIRFGVWDEAKEFMWGSFPDQAALIGEFISFEEPIGGDGDRNIDGDPRVSGGGDFRGQQGVASRIDSAFEGEVVVTSGDGAIQAIIPPNAVPGSADIYLNDLPPDDVPHSEDYVWRAFEFWVEPRGPMPDGFYFTQPVEIMFNFDQALQDRSEYDPNRIRLLAWDDRWIDITEGVNMEDRVLFAFAEDLRFESSDGNSFWTPLVIVVIDDLMRDQNQRSDQGRIQGEGQGQRQNQGNMQVSDRECGDALPYSNRELQDTIQERTGIRCLSDMSQQDHRALEEIDLCDTGLEDDVSRSGTVPALSGIGALKEIKRLYLCDNGLSVMSLTELVDLDNIEFLDLTNNNIPEIEPLTRMNGLGNGDRVLLFGNPLDMVIAFDQIEYLRSRGVNVEHDFEDHGDPRGERERDNCGEVHVDPNQRSETYLYSCDGPNAFGVEVMIPPESPRGPITVVYNERNTSSLPRSSESRMNRDILLAFALEIPESSNSRYDFNKAIEIGIHYPPDIADDFEREGREIRIVQFEEGSDRWVDKTVSMDRGPDGGFVLGRTFNAGGERPFVVMSVGPDKVASDRGQSGERQPGSSDSGQGQGGQRQQGGDQGDRGSNQPSEPDFRGDRPDSYVYLSGNERDTLFLESSDRRVEIEIRPNVAQSNGGNFHLALYRFDIAKTCHTCIKKPPTDLFPGGRPTDHFEVNFGFQMAVVENPGSVGLNGPAGISVKMGRNLAGTVDVENHGASNIRLMRLQPEYDSYEDITRNIVQDDDGEYYLIGEVKSFSRQDQFIIIFRPTDRGGQPGDQGRERQDDKANYLGMWTDSIPGGFPRIVRTGIMEMERSREGVASGVGVIKEMEFFEINSQPFLFITTDAYKDVEGQGKILFFGHQEISNTVPFQAPGDLYFGNTNTPGENRCLVGQNDHWGNDSLRGHDASEYRQRPERLFGSLRQINMVVPWDEPVPGKPRRHPYSVLIGAQESDCYMGPLFFENSKNGLYGLIDPLFVFEGHLAFRWYVGDNGVMDFTGVREIGPQEAFDNIIEEFYTDGPSRSTNRYEGPPASIVPTWEMKVNNPPSGNVVMTPINDGVWQAGKLNNIDFGTAIVKEGRSFDIGLGPMDYSSAEMGSGNGKGYFYDNEGMEYANIIPAGSGACDDSYPGHAGVNIFDTPLDSQQYKYLNQFEERGSPADAFMFGTMFDPCYQGIIVFRKNGRYGAIEPIFMSDYGDLTIRWWVGAPGVGTFKGIPANFYMTRNLQNNATNMLQENGLPFMPENFKDLWRLEFQRFKWADFGGLQLFPGLEEIWVFGDHSQRGQRHDLAKIVTMLNDLPALRAVLLGNLELNDISVLRELVDIQELMLFSNRIGNVKPLSELTNLNMLDLSDNPVRDISPLSNLQNLRFLGLAGTQVRNISPLLELRRLEFLIIDESMLDTNSKNNVLPRLRSNGTRIEQPQRGQDHR